MIKILFFSKNFESPSSDFNYNLLKNIDKNFFYIKRINQLPSKLYQYQFLLVLGYDANFISKKVKKNNGTLIGLIDPRPSQRINLNFFDFFINNGLEMSDWLNKIRKPQFYLPIYPPINKYKNYINSNSRTIKLGYHGNLVHLNSFKKKLVYSLNNLKNYFNTIELILVYDMKNLGKFKYFDNLENIKVFHYQWSKNIYTKKLIHSDIGLVPGTININYENFFKTISSSILNKNNENLDDYLIRSKVTTNIGRHLVFAQLKIPIVADFTPSSLQFIDHGINGYVCNSKESFSKTIEELSLSVDLRKKISDKMFLKYNDKYTLKILLNNFQIFLNSLIHDRS